MQEIDSTYERSHSARQRKRPLSRRLLPIFGLLLLLILIGFALPLLNVNRFQRRIVTSLSESLGRPIHLDRISLTVFPLPGLTIENFVIADDPAFGAEPFVRASEVRATLRISSLWRRRIEFTRISFTDPSINLVRTSAGKWNLEGILLQAARINAAPTAQTRSSAAPRFPYIEATGARLNLKLDQEKTPISLTEAEVALWLNTPQQWQLRLSGKPVRTDTSASDTGTIRLEGTLGRAAALNDVPIDLHAEWRNAPLGEASRVVLGHDAGVRGSMLLSASAQGTVGRSSVQAALHFTDMRRADFVPLHTVSIDAECQAIQTSAFRSVTDISCSWPQALTAAPKTFALTASIPDTHAMSKSSADFGTPGIPAAALLDWMHVASSRLSPDISATGTLAGSVFLRPEATPSAQWGGQFTLADASLIVPSVADLPIISGTVSGRVISLPGNQRQRPVFVLAPVPLMLGGRDFATVEGRLDQFGYTLHLTGTALPSKLLALGAAVPQLGDGLSSVLPTVATSTPFRFDLTSTRNWGGAQFWQGSRAAAAVPRHFMHR
ncbi:AsmA family protein [Granulicella arctica]|uniref:AsmA family protein n=1 Tax=Granulicella arctica TaxID=940613 RepID=UPI0021DF89B8|nr:AsmA family protein [Granulicella arctica]